MVQSKSGPAVLLTGAGGAAAVSFIKAVEGEPFVIHAADMDPYAAGLYLVPPSQRHRILPGADPHFVPHLLELCHRHAMDVLVPTVDVELLAIARARKQFESAGVRLLLASEETLAICLDKLTLLRTCDTTVPVGRYAALDDGFAASGLGLSSDRQTTGRRRIARNRGRAVRREAGDAAAGRESAGPGVPSGGRVFS